MADRVTWSIISNHSNVAVLTTRPTCSGKRFKRLKRRTEGNSPGYLCAPRFHAIADYVRKRNALIPEAAKIASAKVAIERDDGEGNAAWTRCFSIAMDTLSAPQMVDNNQ